MVRVFSLIVLEMLGMDGFVMGGARILGDSPAAIADVADSFALVGLDLVSSHFECEFAVMGMMLESSHKTTSIKEWSPIFQPCINNKPIILKIT